MKTYVNKQNEHKYIETKKYKDGHTVWRQYMMWDNGIKSYNGCTMRAWKTGRWHRVRAKYAKYILDWDYTPTE